MAEPLEAVPVRRDRRGQVPLLDAVSRQLDQHIADERLAVIDVSGPVAQVKPAMRIQGREIHDQIVQPGELAKRDLIDRKSDSDDGAAAGLDRDLLPLQRDLLREPVDRQHDPVLDALAGDDVLDPLPSKSERQAHDRLKGVALPASLWRRPGLAAACPEVAVAQSGDELGGHAGAVVGDLDPALADADVDFRPDRAGLLDRVQRIVAQLLDDRARPQLLLAAQTLAQLGGADGSRSRRKENAGRASRPLPFSQVESAGCRFVPLIGPSPTLSPARAPLSSAGNLLCCGPSLASNETAAPPPPGRRCALWGMSQAVLPPRLRADRRRISRFFPTLMLSNVPAAISSKILVLPRFVTRRVCENVIHSGSIPTGSNSGSMRFHHRATRGHVGPRCS